MSFAGLSLDTATRRTYKEDVSCLAWSSSLDYRDWLQRRDDKDVIDLINQEQKDG